MTSLLYVERNLLTFTSDPCHLILLDGTEGLDTLGAQELNHADPPELPPLVAVGSKSDIRATFVDALDCFCLQPRGEDGVMGLHDLLGGLTGGYDDRRNLSNLEEQ
nr:unnamed protein product [Digitaria exilis]